MKLGVQLKSVLGAASACGALLMAFAGPAAPTQAQAPKAPSVPFQLDRAKLSPEQAAEAKRLAADSLKRLEPLDENLGRLLAKPNDAPVPAIPQSPAAGAQGPTAGGMPGPSTTPPVAAESPAAAQVKAARARCEAESRGLFAACVGLLSTEQEAAWRDAVAPRVVLPAGWDKLGVSAEQRRAAAAEYAHRHWNTLVLDADRRVLAGKVAAFEQFRPQLEAGLSGPLGSTGQAEGVKLAELDERWARAADRLNGVKDRLNANETAKTESLLGALTDDQRVRVAIAEARKLLPAAYVKLGLGDDQVARAAPALKRLAPAIRGAQSDIAAFSPLVRSELELLLLSQARAGAFEPEFPGDAARERRAEAARRKSESAEQKSTQELLAALNAAKRDAEAELARELDKVLTPEQRKKLTRP